MLENEHEVCTVGLCTRVSWLLHPCKCSIMGRGGGGGGPLKLTRRLKLFFNLTESLVTVNRSLEFTVENICYAYIITYRYICMYMTCVYMCMFVFMYTYTFVCISI